MRSRARLVGITVRRRSPSSTLASHEAGKDPVQEADVITLVSYPRVATSRARVPAGLR
jgi:hypothetical protein